MTLTHAEGQGQKVRVETNGWTYRQMGGVLSDSPMWWVIIFRMSELYAEHKVIIMFRIHAVLSHC